MLPAAVAPAAPGPAGWDASALQALAIRMNPLLTTPTTTKLSESDTIGDFSRWSKSAIAEVRAVGLDVLTHLTCGTPLADPAFRAAVVVDPAAAPADLNSLVPILPTMGEYIQRTLYSYLKTITVTCGSAGEIVTSSI